jgi:hypothetical protein
VLDVLKNRATYLQVEYFIFSKFDGYLKNTTGISCIGIVSGERGAKTNKTV